MNERFASPSRSIICVVLCLVFLAGLGLACGGSKGPGPSSKHREEADHSRRARDAFEAGRYESALAYYQEALNVSRSVEDPEAIAANLINLSVVLRQLGRRDGAMAAVDEILDQDPLSFDERWVSEAAFMKAILLQDLGRPSEAASWADCALEVCRKTGCEDMGRIYNLMAKIALERQEAERAAILASQGLEASLKRGDQGETANAYRLMADLRRAARAPAEAVELYEKALALDKGLGRSRQIVLDLMGLGAVHEGLGENAKALPYYKRALAVAESAEDKDLAARIRHQIRALE